MSKLGIKNKSMRKHSLARAHSYMRTAFAKGSFSEYLFPKFTNTASIQFDSGSNTSYSLVDKKTSDPALISRDSVRHHLSANYLINYCKLNLTNIRDLMWGKTSPVVKTIMAGTCKGGASRQLLFLALERSFIMISFFPVTKLRRNGTIDLGEPYIRNLVTGKNYI